MMGYEGQDSGRELRRIVRINEEIKIVVKTAYRINLMAMNAIFLAKRAGQSALGFGVLSNELRRFATDLEQQMIALGQATGGSVVTVTAMVKEARIVSVLERARAQSDGVGREIIDEFLRRRRTTTLTDRQDQVAALNRNLSMMIESTASLVEMGGVLARSAKIEAAYGGGFSQSLKQVSSDFEGTIGEIRKSLDSLGKFQLREFAA
ncbi:MAG: chemotaxis protein [Rhodocyclaceae bacterium]|nr:chemotaxis protein [Rhodocyclaceae bacterium]